MISHADTVLCNAVYHPLPGQEKAFIKLWDDKINKLAHTMGCYMIALYHNEVTDEFFATSQWPSKESCEYFLNSDELRKATQAINLLCLVQTRREMFDILREAAA